MPFGVQLNFPLARLGEGWLFHYDEPYAHATQTSNIRPGRGDCMLWGAAHANASELALAGIGRRARIETQEDVVENGIFWYIVPGSGLT